MEIIYSWEQKIKIDVNHVNTDRMLRTDGVSKKVKQADRPDFVTAHDFATGRYDSHSSRR